MRRETILENLKSRLRTITAANGYTWEPKLFEWLTTPLSAADLPALILKDGDDEIRHDEPSGSSEHSLSVEILLFDGQNGTTASSLRRKLADVMGVVGKEEADGEDLGDYRSVEATRMEIDQSETLLGAARLELLFRYRTKIWEM